MRDFRELVVWHKAHALVLDVYEQTHSFPQGELYGLTSQVRRAAVSIPANIAEGCGRATTAEMAQFCQIAMGSASELEYELLLAKDLHFLSESVYGKLNADTVEIKRMLASFIAKLRPSRRPGPANSDQ